jgi:metal-sulfur cluster biosynthetic enzyme
MTEPAGPAQRAFPLEGAVLEALRSVLDPELDRSLVELGFVSQLDVRGGHVRVELRLPTYWCAPNFSWLMASDVRRAVLAVRGVERVTVDLLDHHAGGQITSGVNTGRSFEEAFGDEATGSLEGLRRLFRRKSFMARQERALRALGRSDLRGLRLGDLPDSAETRAYLAIRSELGLDCRSDGPAVTDPDGAEIEDVAAHLRRARMMRVSMESNTALCRGLFRARYGEEGGDP